MEVFSQNLIFDIFFFLLLIGIFGISSALELRRRGYKVVLIDRNRIPHEEASSTDISKIVRLDYGADLLLTELMEESEEEWRRLNKKWGEEVYHEDGILVDFLKKFGFLNLINLFFFSF